MTRPSDPIERGPAATLSLPPVTDGAAAPAAAALFGRARRELMMVPNMYRRMAHLPALLETYMDGYARFRRDGGFTPAEQEVVLLAISRENGCAYCLAAHSFVADTRAGVPRAVTDAIRNDTEIPDARFGRLAAFTTTMVRSRGRPGEKDLEEFLVAGFTERHVLSLILAIAVKTISNYTNHVCDTEVDGIFKTREWGVFKAAQRLRERLRG
jgi:uncharacterized peroxidase-related enzyme